MDRGTGKVRWSYDTRQDGEPSQFHGNPVITGDLAVTGSDTGAGLAYGFDRTTGALRWKVAAGPIETDLVRAGGTALGVTAEGHLAALDLATGKVAWRVEPETSPFRRFHGRAPAVSGDRAFFGGKDGAVYAVRIGTGAILWRRDLGAAITTSPVLAEGNLFVGTGSARLYRLAPATGEVTAELALSEGPPHALVASGGALLALAGEKALICLEPDLKGIRWTRTAAAGWSTPRPLLLGGAVLAGSEDGKLSAFRIADGGEVWTGKIDGVPRGTSRDGSELYVGTLRGTFLAYRGELAEDRASGSRGPDGSASPAGPEEDVPPSEQRQKLQQVPRNLHSPKPWPQLASQSLLTLHVRGQQPAASINSGSPRGMAGESALPVQERPSRRGDGTTVSSAAAGIAVSPQARRTRQRADRIFFIS